MRHGVYYGPRAVPCECGSTEAYWHGDAAKPPGRVYCCDACWARTKGVKKAKKSSKGGAR